MKKIKLILVAAIMLCFAMVQTAFASSITWEDVSEDYSESILLPAETTSSIDTTNRNARGQYLAEGAVEIGNKGNGEIYVCIDTFAYRNVDRILHTVFLEYWDEDDNDWIQVDYWEFEKTKEEAGGELSGLTTGFTLTGYPTGLYYRLRGLHGVELNGVIEACSTRTDGVLITRN